jgi:two-component system alkaline phosphatase synthesis response regulator PhoP
MLTARSETVDTIVGLKVGADDYVTKPFDMRELMARVEALLRRVPVRRPESGYRCGSITVDTHAKLVTRQGNAVRLSHREFQLLLYFLERLGSSISREQILQDVWGADLGNQSRTLVAHVASLRQKLETDPRRPELIHTVHGFGYRFAVGYPDPFDHPPVTFMRNNGG